MDKTVSNKDKDKTIHLIIRLEKKGGWLKSFFITEITIKKVMETHLAVGTTSLFSADLE